ncbi:MAG: TIGR01841 family phasin [Sulfitobacter sp.]|jgi:phasin family protein|nr:TIGR01841 family phasin [Sulfitobacter sp.]
MADKKDSNPFMDMFQNFGSSMNIPSPDLSVLMDGHRKNLEALQAAAQIGTQTSQELMAKQRAALEAALSDISDAVQEAQASGADPSALMTGQMEMAKRSFDATVKNATEMSQVVQQGSTEAFDILKDRVMASISDITSGKKS